MAYDFTAAYDLRLDRKTLYFVLFGLFKYIHDL